MRWLIPALFAVACADSEPERCRTTVTTLTRASREHSCEHRDHSLRVESVQASDGEGFVVVVCECPGGAP